MSRRLVSIAAGLLLAAACGSSRTTAATQPGNPAAFDAKASDPKAVAIADKVLAAVGGAAAWEKVKEIQWTTTVYDSGSPKAAYRHGWDRWNGRHFLETPSQGDGDATQAMYELYTDTAAAMVVDSEGRKERANADQTKKIVANARQRFAWDVYPLMLPFKLKDPGAHLAFVEERRADGATEADPMKYDVIKLTFDKGVGPTPGDVYYVVVDKQTSLIDQIEVVETGKQDTQRMGYKWSDWVDVGGLKFCQARQNIGFAAEKITYTNIKTSENPEEDLYVPVIEEPENQ